MSVGVPGIRSAFVNVRDRVSDDWFKDSTRIWFNTHCKREAYDCNVSSIDIARVLLDTHGRRHGEIHLIQTPESESDDWSEGSKTRSTHIANVTVT
jgi:hypothetical protein